MELQAKITKIDRIHVQAANEEMLDVQFDIEDTDADEKEALVASKRLALPLDTAPEKVTSKLKKHVKVLKNDIKRSEALAELEAARENADKVQKELEGTVVTTGSDKKDEDIVEEGDIKEEK